MTNILVEQCKAILEPELPAISNIANILSVLFNEIDHINWAGLYLVDPNKEVCYLGPFLGKPACTKIAFGKGVVGTSAEEKRQIVVKDVHLFEGHIACDCQSNSEIVISLIQNDTLYAILDIDSDVLDNFDQETTQALEQIAHILSSLVSKETIWSL